MLSRSEQQRSPDDEHHELLIERLCHVQAGQRNFLHERQEGPRRHQHADIPPVPLETSPWIQQWPATKSAHSHLKLIFRQIADLMTSHWQTAWENENTDKFYRHLQPDVSYKIKYRIQTRREDTTITRLRLGNIIMNAGLHKIAV